MCWHRVGQHWDGTVCHRAKTEIEIDHEIALLVVQDYLNTPQKSALKPATEPQLWLWLFRLHSLVGRVGIRQGKALAGPSAQIHLLAALTTKGPPRIAGAVQAWPLARWAGHGARSHQRSGIGQGGSYRHGRFGGHQAHKESSKAASSVLGSNCPSGCICSIRTDTRSRLPLISGTKPKVGSMAKRSS